MMKCLLANSDAHKLLSINIICTIKGNCVPVGFAPPHFFIRAGFGIPVPFKYDVVNFMLGILYQSDLCVWQLPLGDVIEAICEDRCKCPYFDCNKYPHN